MSLEQALTISASGDHTWTAFADPQYEATNGMYGGWTAAVLLRGVLESPDRAGTASAITVNFLRRVAIGTEVSIQTRPVGGSRSIHHWTADLTDADGQLLAHALIVCCDRRDTDGRTEWSMPTVPEPDELEEFHPPSPQGERCLHRPISGYPPFAQKSTASSSWVKETTGRPVDHVQLAFLADNYAPRCFYWSEGPRLSATMTLSVYFHATSDEIDAIGDDYVLNEATATRGHASTVGQQARLWSRDGKLLITTEQLCSYR